MNPLVIRTAAPFGYLVVFAALFAAGFIGLCLVVFGLLSRRSSSVTGGAALTFFIAYVFWVNIAVDRDLDLNPRVAGMEALSGTWVYGSAVLDLTSDGNYRCRGGGERLRLGDHGVWVIVENTDIAFRSTATGPGPRYRIVSYRRHLRLAHPIDDDPDLWDGVLLFEQTPPTRAD